MFHARLAKHHSHPSPDFAPVLWSVAAILSIVLMAVIIYLRANPF